MMRIVLVDGENLTHGLRRLFGDGVGAARTELANYDYRGLIEELLVDERPSEILWFGARLRQYNQTEEMYRKSKEAIAQQAEFINLMQAQKITFIKIGYLRARQSSPCAGCSRIDWSLAEKGVDVGVAVRLLREARSDVELVVVSTDTDLLPAIQEAKRLGAKIMHVGYEIQPVMALSQVADRTRLITAPLAKKYMKTKDES